MHNWSVHGFFDFFATRRLGGRGRGSLGVALRMRSTLAAAHRALMGFGRLVVTGGSGGKYLCG